MDAMKAIYIEEANELLANLEISLLTLENDMQNKRFIEEIFRVMHTLKGNSSMFGLQKVAEFVHDLETIYDKVRNQEMQLNKELLDLSFLCLDHLKIIIHDSELAVHTNSLNHNELLVKIGQHISASTINRSSEPSAVENSEQKKKQLYYILFEPNQDIFNNGTNPVIVINELTELGKSLVIPHFKIKGDVNQNPNDCFTYWEIFLETDKTVNTIKDVFVFVEDLSVIQIEQLTVSDLIETEAFIEYVTKDTYNDAKLNIDLINTKFSYEKKEIKDVDQIQNNKPAKPTNTNKVESLKDKTNSSIRVSSEKLDELMNLVSELVTTQAALTMYAHKTNTGELDTIAENVEKLSRRLRDIAFGMTLVPINNMFSRFQRMVRDVSTSLGKEVEFITEGGETELDKSIIETLTDPLMHILRNSLDHGIETTESRLLKGKDKCGKVILKAFYSGVYVYIQITDDGKGIDPENIRKKAISKGIIKHEDYLSEEELFDLIFYPGFSTAEKITDVSGRGVGMDVVKRNVTDLKGSIKVESVINEGTTLTIKLPLTLSIIDGLLVSIEKTNYIIPLSVITKCYLVNNIDMKDNFNNLLYLDDEQTPFINIRQEFGHNFDSKGKSQLIVVNNGERHVGLSVDEIIGEYQAVVKPLGKHYKNQDFVSGASILGDGTIALVLDSNKLIEMHTKNLKLEEVI